MLKLITNTMTKTIAAVGISTTTLVSGVIVNGGAGQGIAAAVPLIGEQGLCPNASALAAYIRGTYPGVLSIGGVRQDRLPDHPSGHALDIMIGSNMALGDTIAADVRAQSSRFGMKYLLWRVTAHFDHVHVTVL